MKLSTKYRYGSRAILEIAKRYGDGPIKRKELVRILDIPDSYLENILVAMKNGGLINTTRGANGGYVMAVDPSMITLYDVIKAMGGDEAPVICLEDEAACSKVGTCTTRDVWKRMKNAMDNSLKENTIAQLISQEGQMESNYSI